MRLFLRAIPRRNIITIFAGIMLAGAPLVAFNFWLESVVSSQGRAEVETAVRRAISLADTRLHQTIVTLDRLAAQGVNSCAPDHTEAMRLAAFNTSPIKEVAIVDPDGHTICSNLGFAPGERKIVASTPLAGAEGYTFDIIQMANAQRMVRLRHTVGAGPNAIAALVPVVLLLPQIAVDGSPFTAYAQVATRD